MKRCHKVIILLSLLTFTFTVISGCTKSPSNSEIKRVIGEYMRKEVVPVHVCSKETLDAAGNALTSDVLDYKGANVDEIKIVKTGHPESLEKGGYMKVTAYVKGSFGPGKYGFSGNYEFSLVKNMYGELAVTFVPTRLSGTP